MVKKKKNTKAKINDKVIFNKVVLVLICILLAILLIISIINLNNYKNSNTDLKIDLPNYGLKASFVQKLKDSDIVKLHGKYYSIFDINSSLSLYDIDGKLIAKSKKNIDSWKRTEDYVAFFNNDTITYLYTTNEEENYLKSFKNVSSFDNFKIQYDENKNYHYITIKYNDDSIENYNIKGELLTKNNGIPFDKKDIKNYSCTTYYNDMIFWTCGSSSSAIINNNVDKEEDEYYIGIINANLVTANNNFFVVSGNGNNSIFRIEHLNSKKPSMVEYINKTEYMVTE